MGKSGENAVDVLNQGKRAFKEEFNEKSFTQKGSWEVLRKCAKWDAPEPVDSAPVEGGHAELFDEDPRPRPPEARAAKKTNLRACRAQEKDWAVIKFEELRFLATKTDGLSGEDLEIIEMQKEEICRIYRR
ncbi:hypothetical protein Tco_1109825 [Tanacetum coccineum]|uniref:No apical meristem-associated C-terminal domain-containing protein n=1 Tax=Tanacetum coccineum TaxID=301880 RepID=A0ABQ5IH49_9ASTR